MSEAAAKVILRCIATRREDRYANAEAVAAALEQVLQGSGETNPSVVPPAQSRPAPAFVRTTLALLPITNESGPEHDYLVDSLSEDLHDVLDAVPEIRVRPRTYGGGIDAEVDGTLRVEAERVHVTLRLFTVEDGIVLWERGFESAVSEIVTIVDAAAAAIAEALTTKAMGRRAACRRTPSRTISFSAGVTPSCGAGTTPRATA